MLSACASVESLDGQRMSLRGAAFREYVEQVFRLQNRVSSEIAFALEAPERIESEQSSRLELADTALFEACESLNELAVRRRDGRGMRLFADAHAARTAPDCERAADEGRAALLEAGIEIE